MIATAENDASQWADVAVVAAPGQGDVSGSGEHIVRRVNVDPAEAVTVECEPGMRGVGARETWPPGWRLGFDVTAHITRRQTERAEAGDLNLRKVLTYTDAILENFLNGRADGRGFVIELEVAIDPAREIKHSLENRTIFDEGRPGIIGELLHGFDER